MASSDGWEDVPVGAEHGWETVPVAAARPNPTEMSAKEAVLHGAVEGIPFGQKLAAGGTAAMQGAVNLLPRGVARRFDLAQAPAGAAYGDSLANERAALERAKQDQKWATRGGEALGGGLSMAAMSPLKAAQGDGALARYGAAAGNAGLYGAAHGAGKGDTLADALRNAGIEGATMAALSAPGQAVAEAAGPASRYAGGKLKDLAGWLKVNSIHPTPKLGEAMADLPGGVSGIGKELLQRRVGGLTKHGTADQIEAELAKAGEAVSGHATAYDAAGGEPVDVGDALELGGAHVRKLMDEPTTKAAGSRLGGLVSEYLDKYAAGEAAPVSAEEALGLKRALGSEAYGARDQLAKSGDKISGDYGAGVAKLERGVDAALDSRLGPGFEASNLTYRRLLGAKQAAERAAARTASNHLIGLIPATIGAGVAAGGHATPSAIGLGLASALASKYGAQASSRGLYGLGRGLELAPEAAASLMRRAPGVASAVERARLALGPSDALIEALRSRATPLSPGVSQGDETQNPNMLAAMLRSGP